MSLERFHNYRERKNNFEVSPNPAAAALEQTLGISFPEEQPRKIVLNNHNINILTKKVGIMKALGGTSHLEVGKVQGYYDPQFNAFFTDKTSPPRMINPEAWYMDLHESMHGFNAQTNPEFAEKLESLKVPPLPGVLDNVIRHRALDEGIATWAGIETTMHTGTNAEKEKVQSIKRLLLTGIDQEIADNGLSHVLVAANDLQNNIHQIDRLFYAKASNGKLNKEEKQSFRYYGDSILNSEGKYTLGLYFVDGVMQQLRSNGFTTAEALQVMLNDVPQTLEAFTSPEEYAKVKITAKSLNVS